MEAGIARFVPNLNERLIFPYGIEKTTEFVSNRKSERPKGGTEIAYKEAHLLIFAALNLKRLYCCALSSHPSNRPKQVLQFEQISCFRLPILDADMAIGSLTRCSSISAISRRFTSDVISPAEYPNPSNRLRTRRGMPAVMKALGPSRSYSANPPSRRRNRTARTGPNLPPSRLNRKFSGMYSPIRITGAASRGSNLPHRARCRRTRRGIFAAIQDVCAARGSPRSASP